MDLFGIPKKKEAKIEDIVVSKARACLAMNEFKDYREAYEKEEREIIGTLLVDAGKCALDDNGSLEKFGAKCLVRLNRLRDVRGLLRDVTINASKGGK